MGTEQVAALHGLCCTSLFGVSSDAFAVSFYADVELGGDRSMAGKAVPVGNPRCLWVLVPGVLWGSAVQPCRALLSCCPSPWHHVLLGTAPAKKAFHRLD